MKIELDRLPELIEDADAELFDKTFEELGRGAEIGADTQQRILSSVMRKAGHEMKDNITVKKTRRHGKRFIGFAVAAAVLATGAVGGYAYNSFFNKRSVEQFIENPDKLEEDGFAVNRVMSNEYMNITLDTVISDGFNAYIIFTTEKLADNIGGSETSNFLISEKLLYADNGELIGSGSGTGYLDSEDANKTMQFTVYDLDETDTSRDLNIMFYAFDIVKYDGISCETDEYEMPIDNPFGHDMYTTVSFSKNCDIETLTSADGKHIRLSQFEIICDDISLSSTAFDNEQIKLIKNDGSYDIPDGHKSYIVTNDKAISADEYLMTDCAIFGKFIDLENYKGVEINGVEYLAE